MTGQQGPRGLGNNPRVSTLPASPWLCILPPPWQKRPWNMSHGLKPNFQTRPERTGTFPPVSAGVGRRLKLCTQQSRHGHCQSVARGADCFTVQRWHGTATPSWRKDSEYTGLTGEQEHAPLQSHEALGQHVFPRQTPGCQVIL